jgi:hypothetical protein
MQPYYAHDDEDLPDGATSFPDGTHFLPQGTGDFGAHLQSGDPFTHIETSHWQSGIQGHQSVGTDASLHYPWQNPAGGARAASGDSYQWGSAWTAGQGHEGPFLHPQAASQAAYLRPSGRGSVSQRPTNTDRSQPKGKNARAPTSRSTPRQRAHTTHSSSAAVGQFPSGNSFTASGQGQTQDVDPALLGYHYATSGVSLASTKATDFSYTVTDSSAGGGPHVAGGQTGWDLSAEFYDQSGLGGPSSSSPYVESRQYASSVSDNYAPSPTQSEEFQFDEETGFHPSRGDSASPLPPESGKSKASDKGKGKDASTEVLKCTFENCTSKVTFTRRCDLAKHYKQHFRRHYCRLDGCSSAGFATKKDRDRHERTHNPSIECEYCNRKFSRQDNLRDHVRRRHFP